MPPFFEVLAVGIVEFKAVAVAFLDLFLAVGFGGNGAWLQHAGIQSQAHGAAHVGDGALLGHQVDDRVGRSCGRTRSSWHLSSPSTSRANSTHHQLHAQAQPQVGDLLLAGIAGRLDLAFDAAASQTRRAR